MPAFAEVPRRLGRPPASSSVETRQRILDVARQAFAEQGWETTTNHYVAEKAGVSIGSLYEYFPNKESLVAALASVHIAELMARVDAVLSMPIDETLRAVVAALIRAGLDAHRIDPALHKVLVEQVPRIGTLAASLDISSVLQRKIEGDLRRRAPRLPAARVRIIALVLETCIEALTHRAVVDAPDWLETGEIEREALRLLEPYIDQALISRAS